MSNIVLKEYGSGETTLVCFPGWIHPVEKEPVFLKLLSKKYKIISIHLPGYVSNGDLDLFADFSSLIESINSELEKLKTKKIVFLGFSLGCRLIMELEKKFPNKTKKIFIACPVGNYETPFWAHLLLISNGLINILRKNKKAMKYIVERALRKIANDPTAVFNSKSVSLVGAYDSLVGLLRSKADVSVYLKTAMFVYGENDYYVGRAKDLGVENMVVVDNAGHNCVRGYEEKVVRIIDELAEGDEFDVEITDGTRAMVIGELGRLASLTFNPTP